MNSAQARGLGALSQSIDKDNQNERNLAYMSQLHQMNEQEKQAQEEAAVKEQQYYALLNDKADGLLAPDKKESKRKDLLCNKKLKSK